MNEQQMKGRWHEVKGKIRRKWGKLTDDEIEQASGQTEKLLGSLQRHYGYSKEEAQSQVDEFNKSLS